MEKQIKVIEARNYLVKGCAPQVYKKGEEFPIDQEGPVNQRRFQIVDDLSHIFYSLRDKGFERLALVQPKLEGNTLILQAPGMPDCEVPCDAPGVETKTTTWDAEVPAIMHPDASEWISDFMKQNLHFMQQAGNRPINSQYAPPDATVSFADRFPLTVVSQETIDMVKKEAPELLIDGNRFRYNLLISGGDAQDEHHLARFRMGSFVGTAAKPCGRCQAINVNQETGEKDDLFERLKKSRTFRNPHSGETIISENVLVEQPGVLTVGSPVEVLEWSEQEWDREYKANNRRQPTVKGDASADGLWRQLRGKGS